jgi:four helix bundle protein
MKDFRSLKVWEKSHLLTLAVYKASAGFPTREMYGLTSQLRRACMSVPSNIAEGCGRHGDTELARFLQIASETEYQLLLAHDLGYLDDDTHNRLTRDTTEVKQMLTALIQRLRADP